MNGIIEIEEKGALGRRESQRLKESLLLEKDPGGGLLLHWDQTVGTGASIGLARHGLNKRETAMRHNLLLSYLENILLKPIESETNNLSQESTSLCKIAAILHCKKTTATASLNSKTKPFIIMNSNRDRISNLPSSLLVIIASFLPFKEAARTSVLSKQWLNIWRDAMHIQFNETFFVKSDEPEENRKVQREVFINFARQFIANYSQQVIKTLGLACSKPADFLSDIQNILMFASSRDVRELGLDFSDPTWREQALENHQAAFELPLLVYEHGRVLRSLKLFSCSFKVSNFSNFCALKTLSLGWIKINMGSISAILDKCPLLENLSLKKCWDIENFEISKPGSRLKSLVLEKCDIAYDGVLIEGPKLQFFKFSGNVGEFLLKNQSDLVKAELDFEMETEFDEIGLFLYNLLQDLFAAQVLTVCSVFLQIVPSGDEPLGLQAPIDVRHLILKTALHINEFCGIKFMLRSCPHLEILTIDIVPANILPDYGAPYPFNPHGFWSKDLMAEECVTGTLKAVNVKGFTGMMNELQVLRYLLHSGRAMEELNLYVSDEGGSNGETRELYMGRAQQVLQFNKASRNLNIAVL